MRALTLILALFFAGSGLQAAQVGVGGDVSGTVKVGGLEVGRDQILVTPKKGYVHIIWDAYPSQAAIKAAGAAFKLETAAKDLATGLGVSADPKAKFVKVDIAEFPVRDDYGAPRWDKLAFLGRYEVKLKGKKWSVKPKAK